MNDVRISGRRSVSTDLQGEASSAASTAKARRKRGSQSGHHRALRCEPLEDRRMLSVAGGVEMDADEAIQFFSTQAALFVEN